MAGQHTVGRPGRAARNRFFYFFYSGSQVFLMPYLSLDLQQDLAWEPWRVGCGLLACNMRCPLQQRQHAACMASHGELACRPQGHGARNTHNFNPKT